MFGKRSAVIVVGTALLTLAGAALYATIPAATGVIYGCYNRSGGAIRVIDNAVIKCGSNETQLTWNQTGPQGPTGPAGADGAQGPAGPSDIYVAGKLQTFGSGSSDVVQKTLFLPQGSWLIGAKVGFLNITNPSSVAQCRISTSNTVATFETTLDDVAIDYSVRGFLGMTAPLDVPSSSGQNVYLICGLGPNDFPQNPELYAIKTGKLTLQ